MEPHFNAILEKNYINFIRNSQIPTYLCYKFHIYKAIFLQGAKARMIHNTLHNVAYMKLNGLHRSRA